MSSVPSPKKHAPPPNAPDELAATSANAPQPADADPDFYTEDGFTVFTAAFLLRRGYCCGNGCRHCPYGDEGAPASSS